MSKYKQYYFFSIVINSYNQICPGWGWESEIVEIDYSMRWHAQDCYKDIITDICNWSKAWSGFDAKYIDECTDSLEVNIPIKNKIYREAKDDIVIWGTVDPNSRKFCYDIPLLG